MKVLHVIPGLKKAAGTSVFAGEVANGLVALGHEVAIAVVDPTAVDCYPLDPRVKLVSFSDVDVAQYDVIHIHSLWATALSRIAKAAHKVGVKVVWSPHGMLTPWALKNKWWKKLFGLVLYQYWSLRKANLIHVTAQSEVSDVRRLGLKNEVVIAPLGVRIKEIDIHSTATPSIYSTEQKHTLLFVSRVQRKKGLPNLLKAWARLPEDLKSDWTIRIVGPDQDNHTAELMRQCESLGLSYSVRDGKFHCTPTPSTYTSTQPQVAFVGPKYEAGLDAEYANADLFVLPTHSENFGSVVIESLAHSVPVICTKEAPWAELETHNCGWWIDDDVDALFGALKEALPLHSLASTACSNALHEMGARGLELVKSKYTWAAVVTALVSAYKGKA